MPHTDVTSSDSLADSASTLTPVECTGTLKDERTGYFLQDLGVKIFFVEPNDQGVNGIDTHQTNGEVTRSDSTQPTKQNVTSRRPYGDCERTLLGSAISQADGTFQISWNGSEKVHQRRYLLAIDDAAMAIVQITSPEGDTILNTEPTAWGTTSVKVLDLSVPIHRCKVDDSHWCYIQDVVKRSGDSTLSSLVNSLVVVPTAASSLSKLPIITRLEAVSQLEEAFLDPTEILRHASPLPSWNALARPNGIVDYKTTLGNSLDKPDIASSFDRLTNVVTQFPSISTVDWKIDPDLLTRNLADAITKFPVTWRPGWNVPFFPFQDQNLTGYRDYLVKQWQTVILNTGPIGGRLNEADVYVQLTNRFHQNFKSTDTSSKSTNELLIPIMTDILTSSTSNFGFGVATSTLPPRGSDTSRGYLNKLIALTGFSAEELSLRYRTDFTQQDAASSSPVDVNIYTLQGFLKDSFQSVADPIHTQPDTLHEPIIPKELQNLAPFFLQYDEWKLRQQPIPFENYFQIRNIVLVDVNNDDLKTLQQWAGAVQASTRKDWSKFVLRLLNVQTSLQQAFKYVDQFEFASAASLLDPAKYELISMVQDKLLTTVNFAELWQSRQSQQVNSFDDLVTLMEMIHTPSVRAWGGTITGWIDWDKTWKALACSVIYALNVTHPWLMAQIARATGDYPKALFNLGRLINFLVGQASISDDKPYRPYYIDVLTAYHTGDLPYTVRPNAEGGYPLPDDDGSYYYIPFAVTHYPETTFLTKMEKLFVRLQMADIMLQWADSLYRTDQAANIARARELYKGVYFLHGVTPPINPTWTLKITFPNIPRAMNPAKLSQLARAQRGFAQVKANLNFFGFPRDIVPTLRYSSLKPAADAFAASAKSIQGDFLSAIQQLEELSIETFKNTAMLQRTTAQQGISRLQANIAKDQVTQAAFGVSQVMAAIAAKKQEIEDHDSFFGQLKDYIGGLSSIWKDLPGDTQSVLQNSAKTEAGFSAASTEGFLGLGTAATVTAGFGAFFVASYITMSGMADSQNGRQAQLDTLENQNLPAAQAGVDIAQNNMQIAQLNQQVADADAALAENLIAFTQTRFLNAEFWSYLAGFFQRVLRQYLDLASSTGWLAERALAYELDTPMGVMKLDYFNSQKQGAGSAEALQLDLASLEAKHLQAQVEMLPIKFTVSLARDFPLQFGQLRATGACSFQTLDKQLQAAYMGTYSHRILAVQPQVSRTSLSAPLRGMLSNEGFSSFTRNDGQSAVSTRPQDALPISEFNITSSDAGLNGLPGTTLMPFEGSGVDTVWTLQFPRAANPGGLTGLVDVLLTLNIQARFSASLYQTQMGLPPSPLNKTLLVSVGRSQRSALLELQKVNQQWSITFDKSTLPLHNGETNRKLNNIFFVLVGGSKPLATVKAKISTPSNISVDMTFEDFVAFSNAPPVTDTSSTIAKSPLNALSGSNLDQGVVLTINKSQNSQVDFTTLQDIWVGLDYTAKLS